MEALPNAGVPIDDHVMDLRPMRRDAVAASNGASNKACGSEDRMGPELREVDGGSNSGDAAYGSEVVHAALELCTLVRNRTSESKDVFDAGVGFSSVEQYEVAGGGLRGSAPGTVVVRSVEDCAPLPRYGHDPDVET
jgi:hypothetical protein